MDMWTALAILRRRWIIVVSGALLTLAGLVGAMTIVPITYQTEGEIILLVPTENLDESVVAQNAYLGFGGSLNVVTFVLARAAGGQQAATEILEQGGKADFVVDLVPGDAPMLSITATSKDPAEAMSTYQLVLAHVEADLAARQDGVKAPSSLRIVAEPVRTPVEPTKQAGSLMRAAAGIVVIGAALTIAIAFLRESIVVRKAARGGRRRDRKAAATAGADDRAPVGGGDNAEVPLSGRRAAPGAVDGSPQAAGEDALIDDMWLEGSASSEEILPSPTVSRG
jgi:hypothetical protein